MIESIADLIDAIKKREEAALAAFPDVEHPGITGAMYEGLTRELLQQAVFRDHDLRVETGKIRLPDGSLSRQMDVMVVVGEGTPIPYTDSVICDFSRVVAAIEVKKTLYGDELIDAHQNLLSIGKVSKDTKVPLRLARFVFRRLAHSELPDDGDLSVLGFEKEMMAVACIQEVALPLRVVLGYGGFATEHTLRTGLLTRLEKAAEGGPVKGFAPPQLPSLIISGSNALVKLNALPFSAHTSEREPWLVFASTSGNSTRILLETLWTRLRARLGLPSDIFGEDLEVEVLKPLLLAEPLHVDGMNGWQYRSVELSSSALESEPASTPWEPERLDTDEATILGILCKEHRISTRSSEVWRAFSEAKGASLDAFVERMRYASIAAIDHNGDFIVLTDLLQIVALPDIGFVAADNSTGRLSRWMMKRKPEDPRAGV